MIARWWRAAKSAGERAEVALLCGVVAICIFGFFFAVGLVLRGWK